MEERKGELAVTAFFGDALTTPQEGMKRPEGVNAILDYGFWMKNRAIYAFLLLLCFFTSGDRQQKRVASPDRMDDGLFGIDEIWMRPTPVDRRRTVPYVGASQGATPRQRSRFRTGRHPAAQENKNAHADKELIMDDAIRKKTQQTATTLFGKGIKMDPPYRMWKEFDRDLANDLSMFITGNVYSRGVLSLPERQMVACAMLAALGAADELRLHVNAALNVGCDPKKLAEVFFQLRLTAACRR